MVLFPDISSAILSLLAVVFIHYVVFALMVIGYYGSGYDQTIVDIARMSFYCRHNPTAVELNFDKLLFKVIDESSFEKIADRGFVINPVRVNPVVLLRTGVIH